jgi:ABC-type Fe3+-hydroxamate transport system substrate-binding protein
MTSLDEMAGLVPFLRARRGPPGPDDLLAADLIADPGRLAAEIAATARGRGSDDPHVLASVWWQGYAYRTRASTMSTDTSTCSGLPRATPMPSIADAVNDTAGGFPRLSAEYVLDADPDVIFLAHTDGTGQDPTEVAARPGWGQQQAVRNDAVIVLDADISSRWGPRIVELLAAVVDATGEVR